MRWASTRFAKWPPKKSAAAAITFALISLSLLPTLHAADMIDGSAIVTSRSGSIDAAQAGGQTIDVQLHAVLLPSGTRWTTHDDSQLFITLSNGIALGLDEGSTLRCIEYSQRPFAGEGREVGREPSVSTTLLQLEAGRIAIAGDQLSPLSDLRIRLPFGSIRLHKGICLIEVDSTGLRLTAYEGNFTYYYPDSDAREYVSTLKQVRISEQSAALQQVAETATADALEPEAVLLGQAARQSSRRVIFQPNEGRTQAPVPVLVAQPDYFEQAPLRPYTFKD